jgi:hypothetical protein
MEHKTTAIELTLEPTELFAVLHRWAQESGFVLHEKAAHQVIYSKNILGAKGWVSCENRGGQSRIEVWQSSKNVGPDFLGNIRVGWKTPIPLGFVIGPNGVYREQVNHLFDLLRSQSGLPPTEEIARPSKEATKNRSSLAKGFAVYSAINLLGGIMRLLPAMHSLSLSPNAFANMILTNGGIYEITLGVRLLVCSVLLAKGRIIALGLYLSSVLMDLGYNLALGHRPNYILLGLGMLFLWQMSQFRKEWNLS